MPCFVFYLVFTIHKSINQLGNKLYFLDWRGKYLRLTSAGFGAGAGVAATVGGWWGSGSPLTLSDLSSVDTGVGYKLFSLLGAVPAF